jgi:hypothetical protein
MNSVDFVTTTTIIVNNLCLNLDDMNWFSFLLFVRRLLLLVYIHDDSVIVPRLLSSARRSVKNYNMYIFFVT